MGLFTGEVPAEFWAVSALDVETHKTALATVACMCGEECDVRHLGVTLCTGRNCGRAFMLLNERIRVARFEPEITGPAPVAA